MAETNKVKEGLIKLATINQPINTKVSTKMTKDWKTDFDWTDPNDVQLETIKENCKIQEGELGPDNREAVS